MTSSRRSFLHKAAVFAAITVASTTGFAQSERRELTTNERFGLQTLASDPQETFEPWIGGKFRLSLWGKSLGTLVLASVESSFFPRTQPGMNPMFMSAPVRELKSTILEFTYGGKILPQETYTLTHDWLGTFNLLVEPCLYPDGTVTYIAVMTRFTGKAPAE